MHIQDEYTSNIILNIQAYRNMGGMKQLENDFWLPLEKYWVLDRTKIVDFRSWYIALTLFQNYRGLSHAESGALSKHVTQSAPRWGFPYYYLTAAIERILPRCHLETHWPVLLIESMGTVTSIHWPFINVFV
jgi:hypothetical protein